MTDDGQWITTALKAILDELQAIRAAVEKRSEPPTIPKILRLREVGEWLHMPPSRVLRWTKQGKLPCILGPEGELLFPEPLLAKWLREQPVK